LIHVTNEVPYYAWIQDKLGYTYDPARSVLIVSETPHSGIKACVALYNYVPTERRLDWAMVSNTRRWATCEIAACIIDYIFVRLNVHRLQAYTDQPEAESMLLRFGFKLDANLTDWFGPGKDAKLYSLKSTDLENTQLWEYAKMYYKKKASHRSEGLN
jgi:hypothetical protein